MFSITQPIKESIMTTKKSAYINKKGFIEAVESSNFLEGKALAAQIEEAAELLTDEEFFDVNPIAELMQVLHDKNGWSWGLNCKGKIKIFNQVVDYKLKDDEWRESLLPQIKKKCDEIAKEGRTAGENTEGNGDKKASKKDERRYQFTGINYKGTTINGGVTLDGCVVLSIGNRGEYTSGKMSEEQVEKLCEQGFFKKMIDQIAKATKDELSDSDFSRAIIKTINQAAEAQSKTYEAFGQSIESYLDGIKNGIVDIKKEISESRQENKDAHDRQDKAHQEHNEKLDIVITENEEKHGKLIKMVEKLTEAINGMPDEILKRFTLDPVSGIGRVDECSVAIIPKNDYGNSQFKFVDIRAGEKITTDIIRWEFPDADIKLLTLIILQIFRHRAAMGKGIKAKQDFRVEAIKLIDAINDEWVPGTSLTDFLMRYEQVMSGEGNAFAREGIEALNNSKKQDGCVAERQDKSPLAREFTDKYGIDISVAEVDENGLCKITVSGKNKTIPDNTFEFAKDIAEVVIEEGVLSIGSEAFWKCISLTSVMIPDTVASIGDHAFFGCSGLTSITIPDSVTSIDEKAFAECRCLTSAVIGNGVESIGDYAFLECKCLTSVTIGDGVTSVGDEIFLRCPLLRFNDDGKAKYLGNDANPYMVLYKIYDTNIMTFEIKTHTKVISGNAFQGCKRLYSVTIPNSVTSICDYAFSQCGCLASITIPDSVTSVGEYAFAECTCLTSVTIGNGVESIGRYAFEDCESLKSITIGSGVKKILGGAFNGCLHVTDVYYKGDLSGWLGIEFLSYDSCPMCNAGVIVGAVNLYINGKLLQGDIIIPDGVFDIGEYKFYFCKGVTSVTIPEGCARIGDYAFYGCSDLLRVTIPNSVTRIGEKAFACCNLTSVSISDDVKYIGAEAFYHCNFVEIRIGKGTINISGSAFDECNNLASIIVERGNPVYHSACNCIIETERKVLIVGCKTSVIPDDGSVVSIGELAFCGCIGLTSIEIPDSVTSIGENAFFRCKNLTTINFQGTKTQWKSIKKGDGWDEDAGSYTIHCTDGTIPSRRITSQ